MGVPVRSNMLNMPKSGPAYTFIAIACETLGPINNKALSFLADPFRHIALVTGDHAKDPFFSNASPSLSNVLTLCASRALLTLHLIQRASRSSAQRIYQFFKVLCERTAKGLKKKNLCLKTKQMEMKGNMSCYNSSYKFKSVYAAYNILYM